MEPTLGLLTLALLPGVSPRVQSELRRRGALVDVLSRPDDHADLLPEKARAALRGGAAHRRAGEETERATALGFRVVGLDAAEYPSWLRRIVDPPPVLFVRGTLVAGEGERAAAVVGARHASPAGLAFARSLARALAEAGLAVVSGLARGIDTEAHRGALEGGGRTVAVLGCGLDALYPPENASLGALIAGRGAVVSEFPLGTPPWKANFPRRNRVIAGWGRVVVVVEAGARSGALITARLALDEGRDVMAVPGHPTSTTAAGTNALIKDGAALVRGAADVLEAFGLTARPKAEAAETGDDDVLRALVPDAPASLEEVAARSGRPLPEILARLSELELLDRVRRLPGALYVRR